MGVESIVTGKTGVYGIIGWPVAHSLSPVMQNAALQAAGVDAIYVPFAVEPNGLPAAVSGLRAMNVSGFNVTIPHKISIMPFLDQLSPVAVQAGAVNTVVNQRGRLIGHNTDGDGLVISLADDLGCTVAGSRVVLVGAGGAARGALMALCRAGVRSVVILNRSLVAADSLVASLRDFFPQVLLRAFSLGEQAEEVVAGSDLIVNATSLGMVGEKIEGLPLALLPGHAKVYDMVYSPSLTPLLRDAGGLGIKAVNGLGMLVAQGELAFNLWHGISAERGIMRGALQSFLSNAAKA